MPCIADHMCLLQLLQARLLNPLAPDNSCCCNAATRGSLLLFKTILIFFYFNVASPLNTFIKFADTITPSFATH